MKPLLIDDGLYLGDSDTGKHLQSAHDGDAAIAAVVSVGGGKLRTWPSGVDYLHIGVLDRSDADLGPRIEEAVRFAERHLAAGRHVLVHCRGGLSRSPAVAAAVVMARRRIRWDAALRVVRAARPKANPRPEFAKAVLAWAAAREATRDAPLVPAGHAAAPAVEPDGAGAAEGAAGGAGRAVKAAGRSRR